ncbi:tyrosine phosphatase family protein [Shinella daejeonensis]|uniref:tyrosine phosphatase family protein n=1 Tax=Shinella daejeonensis TaxID=659017 RepID=UPI0020C7782A|nr:tyrosine phosphatase family protein [Shinella daejeonensis]MCP8895737.1 tyrosine phosphatase family protein [Shinella daejeonensis]
MATIVVSPLGKIAELAVRHRCREMVSLIAPKQDFHRPAVIDAGRHLILGVNDITFAGTGDLVAPGEEHVDAIIGFACGWQQGSPLLVHCLMGVSRSPAAALIAALAVAPEQDEGALAERLRRASPQATPNARLIEIGDHLLHRNGRLVAAVRTIGRGADYRGDSPFTFSILPEGPVK